MRIRTSSPTRCFRWRTATSSSRPATTRSTAPDYLVNKDRLNNRARLIEHLSGLTRKFKRDDLLEKLEAVGVPAGPINDLDQVFEDRQVRHRGMRIDPKSEAAKAGSIPGVRTPIMLDGAPMAAEHPAPRLGQHTAEILKEIGEA